MKNREQFVCAWKWSIATGRTEFPSIFLPLRRAGEENWREVHGTSRNGLPTFRVQQSILTAYADGICIYR